MAGYQFFTQPQGPAISVSLFGDAAAQGTNVGNAQPTALTAGIQGLIGGVKQGIGIANSIQDLQIQQHTIDQFPTEDRIQQAQADNAESIASINASKAKISMDTESLQLDVEKAKLKNQADELAIQKTDFDNTQKIAADLANPNAAVRASVLRNPDYQATLIRNDKLSGIVLDRLGNDPGLDPETKKQVLVLQDYNKQKQLDLEKEKIDIEAKKQILGNGSKYQEDLIGNNNLTAIRDAFGLGVKETNQIEFYPQGLKRFDSKTGRMLDVPDADLSLPSVDTNKFVGVVGGKLYTGKTFTSKDADILTQWNSYLKTSGLGSPLPQSSSTPTSVQPAVAPQQGFISGVVSSVIDSAKAIGQGIYDATVSSGTPVQQRTIAGPVPTDTGPQITTQSDNYTVNQAGQALLKKAQQQERAGDPSLMNRLRTKGLVSGGTPVQQDAVAQRPTPSAAPAPLATPEVQGQIAPDIKDQVGLPPVIPTEPPAKKVSFVYDQLSSFSKKYVDPEVAKKVIEQPLLASLTPLQQGIVAVESGGNKAAKAKGSSAEGYFQLTSAAAKDVKVNKNIPAENVVGGVRYFSSLMEKYGNREIPSLLAYNLGPGVIQEAINLSGSMAYDDLIFALNYLKERGRFPEVLTTKNIEYAKKYPFKVLAYKDMFMGLKSA